MRSDFTHVSLLQSCCGFFFIFVYRVFFLVHPTFFFFFFDGCLAVSCDSGVFVRRSHFDDKSFF